MAAIWPRPPPVRGWSRASGGGERRATNWLGTRGAEKGIVYVIQTAQGQETHSPREFYKRFGWKNDPSKVVLP